MALPMPKSVTTAIPSAIRMFWLDVAMHHAFGVRICQRVRNIVEQPHREAQRDVPGIDLSAQRLSPNERHGVVRQPATVSGSQYRDNVRMLEMCGDAEFPLEPLSGQAFRELRREHFDDDVSPEPNVVREEHA